jgi:hypothetical protein
MRLPVELNPLFDYSPTHGTLSCEVEQDSKPFLHCVGIEVAQLRISSLDSLLVVFRPNARIDSVFLQSSGIEAPRNGGRWNSLPRAGIAIVSLPILGWAA